LKSIDGSEFYLKIKSEDEAVHSHLSYLSPYIHAVERAVEIPEWNIVETGLGTGNAFDMDGFKRDIGVDVIHHQGLLEHFSEEEARELLALQTEWARFVIFCVPTDKYERTPREMEYSPDQNMWPFERWLEMADSFRLYEYGVFGIDLKKEQCFFTIGKKHD